MKDKKESSVIPFGSLYFFGDSKNNLLNALALQLEGNTQVEDNPTIVFTPNPEQLVLARENLRFQNDLNSADILLPDGAGLVWAINRQQTTGIRLERIAGREVFHDLLEMAKEKHYKVFLLGGKKGAAKSLLTLDWQADDGPKGNTTQILKSITEYRPDLLFVAYGAPYQERFVIEHKEALGRAGVRVVVVVGGAFEYESGIVSAVPTIVQDLHLEWLQRLIQEPWRWRRQHKGAKFFVDVLLGKYDNSNNRS